MNLILWSIRGLGLAPNVYNLLNQISDHTSDKRMKYQTDDVRITGMQEVAPPDDLIAEIPIDDVLSGQIFSSRRQINEVISGEDPRLLVVVGPCSIHDPKAAIEYAQRLAPLAAELSDDLLIIMRVYFEKPRTIIGWKGLINDPHLDNSYDINHGLRVARKLLKDLTALGLGIGTEYLDPITPQYVGDLISWGAIGARTTESQVHRQLASGLSCAIGFKNSTDGSVQVAVDAVNSASHSHIFLSVTKQGRSAIFSTAGNPNCHIILRGGGGNTNYDTQSLKAAAAKLEKGNLPARIMVDMSHANSEKKHERQLSVGADLCEQLSNGSSMLVGVMIESNLVEGNQSIGDGDMDKLTYGQSITDACINWDATDTLLRDLAKASRARRKHLS